MFQTDKTCPCYCTGGHDVMKTYVDTNHLRLVGKAWEIRATLRRLSEHPITLQELLTRLDQSMKRR
ncbi:Z-ring formation inhibitor MciZ [Brevibacillus sp. SYSU BS000544]|uniref:Z-ring formation inhibitor MciZ n=1 Tax=Brevibacillus sp. SYSU BS000544 TaxID=3416443 RepID=UPI003CE4F3B5